MSSFRASWVAHDRNLSVTHGYEVPCGVGRRSTAVPTEPKRACGSRPVIRSGEKNSLGDVIKLTSEAVSPPKSSAGFLPSSWALPCGLDPFPQSWSSSGLCLISHRILMSVFITLLSFPASRTYQRSARAGILLLFDI